MDAGFQTVTAFLQGGCCFFVVYLWAKTKVPFWNLEFCFWVLFWVCLFSWQSSFVHFVALRGCGKLFLSWRWHPISCGRDIPMNRIAVSASVQATRLQVKTLKNNWSRTVVLHQWKLRKRRVFVVFSVSEFVWNLPSHSAPPDGTRHAIRSCSWSFSNFGRVVGKLKVVKGGRAGFEKTQSDGGSLLLWFCIRCLDTVVIRSPFSSSTPKIFTKRKLWKKGEHFLLIKCPFHWHW